jgi:cytochrome c553
MRNALWFVILVIGGACLGIDVQSSGHSAAHSTPPQPHRLSQGRRVLRHCAGCHGWEGRGDGPIAGILEVKAPRLRGQSAGAVYEAELMARILYGWAS